MIIGTSNTKLRLIGYMYYLFAGLTMLPLLLFPFIFISTLENPFPTVFYAWGVVLVLGGGIPFILAWTGYCLIMRKHWRFCKVVSAIITLNFPIGTVVGIAALLALNNPKVKNSFDCGLGKQETPKFIINSSSEMDLNKKTRNISHLYYMLSGLCLISSLIFILKLIRVEYEAQFLLLSIAGSMGIIIMILFAANAVANHKRWEYCVTVSSVLCLLFPIGTLIGVYALKTLKHPEVQKLFNE